MDRVTIWLRGQIAECSPGLDRSLWLADKLAEATESIWRGSGMVFGMVMPQLAAREALLEECATALKHWLPLIENAEIMQRLADMERRTSIPLGTADYLMKLEAGRTAKHAGAASPEPRNEALEPSIDDHPDDRYVGVSE